MIITGKVAIVTGGSKGIGAAVASAIVQRGGLVVIGDVLEKEGVEMTQALNKKAGKKVAIYMNCDVTQWRDYEALFKRASDEFGGVDIVVLNAGISGPGAVSLVDDIEPDILKVIDVNVGGVIRGTKVALPYLHKRGGGAIVNTASVAGLFASPFSPLYVTSKHAVVGFTRCLDVLNQFNIRVNAVCPFWVDTDIVRGPRKLNETLDKILETQIFTPMETCVQAFLDLIENEDYSGDLLMSLPSGNQLVPKPTLPPGTGSDPPQEIAIKFWQDLVEGYGQALQKQAAKL